MANNKDFKVKNGIKPTVYNEGVGTVVSGVTVAGYNLSIASYSSKSFSVSSQSSDTMGLYFKNDGLSVYVVDATTDNVYQYNLTTAWDISTASYASKSANVSAQSTIPTDVLFNSTGTKMYVIDYYQDVYQYSLSTAWDVSTATYDSVQLDTSTVPTGSLRGGHFKPDGTILYLVSETTPDSIYQYTLSTAYDLSTASYASKSLNVSSQSTTPTDVELNSDGTKAYICDEGTDTIYQYSLSTAWDISTGTYDSVSFSLASQEITLRGVVFGNQGLYLYGVGTANDTIYQYTSGTSTNTASLDLSTGSVFDYTPTSDVQVTLTNPAASGTVSAATLLLTGNSLLDFANASYDSVSFSVSSQDTAPLDVFLKGDGTKMYIVGNGNDSIFQYSLSTAWDLSTASYDSVSFSVASQDTVPFGLFFKPDGFKMYICGWGNDSIYEYVLSTAWDISTASYNSVSLNVSTQDPRPSAIHFKPDGTKLYLCGDEYNAVYQYSLSTAWDLSTASYDSVSFSVGSQDGEPKGLAFTSSGEDMFIAGDITGDIYHYTLSTAFDISTSSYVDSLSHSSQASSPVGIAIKQGSDKMYIIDVNGVAVYQYTIGTGITITYDPDLQWSGGTAPTAPAIGETDVITINTDDGGTTYKAVQSIDGAK